MQCASGDTANSNTTMSPANLTAPSVPEPSTLVGRSEQGFFVPYTATTLVLVIASVMALVAVILVAFFVGRCSQREHHANAKVIYLKAL